MRTGQVGCKRLVKSNANGWSSSCNCPHEDIGPLKHAERRGFSAVVGMRNHLMGLAAYANQIEPDYGKDIKMRLERVKWPVLY